MRKLVLSIVTIVVAMSIFLSTNTAIAASGDILGDVPGPEGIGLLVTARELTVQEIINALEQEGCSAQSIVIFKDGKWNIYIPFAPSIVNASFPAYLPELTLFFVRCAPALPQEVHTPLRSARGEALFEFFNSLPLDCSASYQDLETGESFSVRGEVIKRSASLYKLVLLLGVEQAVTEGRLTLNSVMPSGRTVGEDLHLAITASHNGAAHELGRRLGWQWLTDLAQSYGMSSTNLTLEWNETSSDDVVMFLASMFRGELVSADASAEMLTIFTAEPQARVWLGNVFPSSWEVGTKYGSLPVGYYGLREATVNDSALVLEPGPYAVALLCTGPREAEYYVSLVHELARILIENQ